ncbi:hypothetical protein LMG31886_19070 [Xanthomonas hydrangeae]|nr:hypothetical protein LMG31886_19070 [Xanthomonas hydrangeae]CAD7733464.1 hypothetical protein LMG31886_19070 [Xanthomonas hydrangeae]CAD7746306.1 hypothetical protein LMG31885_41160 [Xanthomonas hydrangeae]CAD7746308.1 hypothetical protein LMG31885_41160 [Xanthomonas hydrangeae]
MVHFPKTTSLRASCAILTILAISDVSASTNSINLPPGTIVQHVVPTAQRDASASYWTLARMQAAVSASFVDDNPVDGDPPELQNSALVRDETPAAGLKVVKGAVPTPKTDPSVPVPGFPPAAHLGVVFFRANGVDQRCTGNAVVSDSGNVVATSGRCVSALTGKFVSHLAFAPAYNGTAPYGIWPATTITADNRWVVGRAVDYDTAFFQVQTPVAMKPSGATLSNTVGASGVRFIGQEDDNEYQVTGYSTDPGANPNTPVSVTSTAEPNPWMNKDYAIEGLEWDARLGVSGSPWVSLNEDTVQDVEVGMTSFAYKQFTHASFGPQWTSAIGNLYQTAAAIN